MQGEGARGVRAATRQDAAALAALVNMAGEGLPLYVWAGMAGPGHSPWDVGRARAQREEGAFSYRNATVREVDGRVVACLMGYPLASAPEPVDYASLPPLFVPLQQLEDLAPDSWYVNVLATDPEHRGKGHGALLLEVAESHARASARHALSLIVADANAGARRLYERRGYRERARRPMIKERWQHPGRDWVLLLKGLPRASADQP